MAQSRTKLLRLFIGNLSNAIVHKLLEKAINIPEIASKYRKEIANSWSIAKIYRQKINPKLPPFPEKDLKEIKAKTISRVRADILLRISKGYENLSLEAIESEVDSSLKEMAVSS
jgi:hypothetical protein